tara:strand:- start:929 stop:2152 length:1224 start_codon:yes stop_codon:yes gene_type:complete
MMSKSKIDLFYLLFNQLVILLGTLFFNKALAFYFDKDTTGSFFYIISISTFGLLVLSAPFTQIFNRLYNSEEPIDIEVFLTFILIPNLVFFTISLFCASDWLAYIFIVYLAFTLRDVFLGQIIQMKERKALFFLNSLGSMSRLVVLALLLIFFEANLSLIVLSQVLSLFTLIYFSYRYYKSKIGFDWSKFLNFKIVLNKLDRSFFILSLPIAITSVASWSKDMGVRFLLNHQGDKMLVADYTFINGLALVGPTFLQGIISAYYLPLIYRKEISYKSALLQVSLILTISTVVGLIVFDFFGLDIVRILLDSKYVNALDLMPYLLLSNMLFVLAGFSGSYFFLIKKTTFLILPSVLFSASLLLSCYYLIPMRGVQGAAYGILFSTTLNCFVLSLILFATWRRNFVNCKD